LGCIRSKNKDRIKRLFKGYFIALLLWIQLKFQIEY